MNASIDFTKWFLTKHQSSGIFVDNKDFEFVIAQLDQPTWDEFLSSFNSNRSDIPPVTTNDSIEKPVKPLKKIPLNKGKKLRVDAQTSTDETTHTETTHIDQLIDKLVEKPVEKKKRVTKSNKIISEKPIIEVPVIEVPVIEVPVQELKVQEEVPVIEVPIVAKKITKKRITKKNDMQEQPIIEVPVQEEVPNIEVPVQELPIIEVPVQEEVPNIEVPVVAKKITKKRITKKNDVQEQPVIEVPNIEVPVQELKVQEEVPVVAKKIIKKRINKKNEMKEQQVQEEVPIIEVPIIEVPNIEVPVQEEVPIVTKKITKKRITKKMEVQEPIAEPVSAKYSGLEEGGIRTNSGELRSKEFEDTIADHLTDELVEEIPITKICKNKKHKLNHIENYDVIKPNNEINILNNQTYTIDEHDHISLTENFVNDILFYKDSDNNWFDISLNPITNPSI
jgi:hypothetical protein